MTYEVKILRRAQKEMARLPKQEYERVRDAIRDLATNPRPTGCKKLIGRDGFRIRIGQYRVIYEIKDVVRVVTVLDIGHRRDVYQ